MDIPQHPDCRPSAPPLVSLSALTAVHHAAEDCLSAVPTGFVSQLEGFGKGRPCRASIIVGTDEPRVWSPLQGYAPWALKRVAPLGLAPPPGNWSRSSTIGA